MNCKQVQEHLLDLAEGQGPAAAQKHAGSCAACAAELASLRQTMSLMDEWRAPEPSPYFNSRLRARLREQAAERVSWWEMLRKPALALALTIIAALSVLLNSGKSVKPGAQAFKNDVKVTQPQPGTAVGDLQYLDKNHDLLATFDLLDDLGDQGAADEQVNP